MGTTPLGLPYPDPDDPVSLGAADIRALAEAAEKLSIGEVVIATITANTGAFGAETPIPGLAFTVATLAGRRYRLAASVNPQSTVANDLIRLRLKDGAAGLTICDHVAVRVSTLFRVEFQIVAAFTAGSHSFALSAERAGGTGTCIIAAAANNPSQIWLEDLGAI
jgi:hypothetical protein